MKRHFWIPLLLALLSATLWAQNNPVPLVNQPLLPTTIAPGGAAFTLTVNGTGFATNASVNWNGSPRATAFVSSSTLQASITPADIARAGTGVITVTNPAPGGGTSLPVYFFVRMAYSSVALVNTLNLPNWGWIAVGDFNGDGKADIAIGQPGGTSIGTIELYLGNGDGTFQTAISTPVWTDATVQPTQILVGDFNGDGKLDLLVGQSNEAGFEAVFAQVFFGNGDGTFTAGPLAGCGNGDYGEPVAVGDVNGDGILDFLFISGALGNQNDEVCLGNGDGTFRFSYGGFSFNSSSPAIGDFNHDDKLDFFSGDQNGGTFLGNGDGTFQGPLAPFTSGNAAIADINFDGNLDVVQTTGYIWLGNGDGTFKSATGLQNPGGNDIKLLDVQGIGRIDVVTLGQTLQIYPEELDLTYGTPLQFTIPQSAAYGNLGVGDFNNDGRIDFVVPGPTYTAIFLQTRLLVSPLSLAYGTVPLGNSVVQTITLTDVGSSSMVIKSIQVVGVNAKDFTIPAKQCVEILGGQTQCTLNVTFTPKTTGPLNASLKITYADVGSPQLIPLSGSGTPVTLSPVLVNFGDQKVGTSSPPVTVTMSNLGSAAVPIKAIAVSGNNFAETNNCGGSLAAHSTCAIQVTFTPKGLGAQSEQLNIKFGGMEDSVSLSGNGT
jgi:VCBS repeat protein/centrosomal CEP192-like protein/HYDIN/CFA65/VesB family protein